MNFRTMCAICCLLQPPVFATHRTCQVLRRKSLWWAIVQVSPEICDQKWIRWLWVKLGVLDDRRVIGLISGTSRKNFCVSSSMSCVQVILTVSKKIWWQLAGFNIFPGFSEFLKLTQETLISVSLSFDSRRSKLFTFVPSHTRGACSKLFHQCGRTLLRSNFLAKRACSGNVLGINKRCHYLLLVTLSVLCRGNFSCHRVSICLVSCFFFVLFPMVWPSFLPPLITCVEFLCLYLTKLNHFAVYSVW